MLEAALLERLKARLVKIKIIDSKNFPPRLPIERDASGLIGKLRLGISQRIHDNHSGRNYLTVEVKFNAYLQAELLSTITVESIFSFENIDESLINPNERTEGFKKDIIAYFVEDGMIHTRAIHYLKVANTTLSNLSIPYRHGDDLVWENRESEFSAKEEEKVIT